MVFVVAPMDREGGLNPTGVPANGSIEDRFQLSSGLWMQETYGHTRVDVMNSDGSVLYSTTNSELLDITFVSAGIIYRAPRGANGSCPGCPTAPASNVSDGPSWMNVAAAEVTIWGGAFTIAQHSSKPLYQGIKSWTAETKLAGQAGRRLGYVGLGLTGYDMIKKGVNTSNTLDATFGVISFLGIPGAIIGGAYFGANLITIGVSAQTIGQHIDNNYYILPGIFGGSPVMLIPKK